MSTKPRNVMLSYQFTGIPEEERTQNTDAICHSIDRAGHVFLCSTHYERYYQDREYSTDEIYAHALKAQKTADMILYFINSARESSGMIFERTQAIEDGQPGITCINSELDDLEWIQPFIDESAIESIRFSTVKELCKVLEGLDYERLSKIRG